MKPKTLPEVRSPSSVSNRNFGFTRVLGVQWLSLWIALSATTFIRAGSISSDQAASSSITESNRSASTRYGLFDWLDHRSAYGQGLFPEPFLVDDSDLEVNEARLDWLHTKRNDQHSDLVKAGVEQGFGLLTLELEVPLERDVSAGSRSEGVGNISVGARYPVYQYVSDNGFVDSTFGAGLEV